MHKEIQDTKEDVIILQEEQHKIVSSLRALESRPEKSFVILRPVGESDRSAIHSVTIHPITINLLGASAATAGNYGYFFIANAACEVVSFQIVYKTAGSDAGTVTLSMESLTGTTAIGGGTELLISALSLKATAATVYTGELIAGTQKFLNTDDRLALKLSGTPTAVDTLSVVVGIKYL